MESVGVKESQESRPMVAVVLWAGEDMMWVGGEERGFRFVCWLVSLGSVFGSGFTVDLFEGFILFRVGVGLCTPLVYLLLHCRNKSSVPRLLL